MSDYYQTLGIDKSATVADIKSAYRKLAMKYHPDRNRGDKSAEQKFKDIQRAYQVLADPEQRQAYDRFGEAGVGGANGGASGFSGFSGMDDVFGEMFSGIFRDGGRANRGRDREVLLTLDFVEAAKGCEKRVRTPQVVECDTCKGDGARPGTRASTCGYCNGQGRVAGGQGFFSVVQTCPQCRGSGRVIRDPCPDCNGAGRVRKMRNLTVKVPSGIDNGMRIRLSGCGDFGGQGVAPGDLYVVVRVKEHSLFRREGHDLFLEVVIPFTAAALGDEVEVPTLNKKVKLKIPPGTQNGALLRLRGKGIHFEYGGEVGDMICEVRVEVPVRLTREQKELLAQLGNALGDGSHRQHPHRKDWAGKVKDFFNSLAG